MRSENRTLYPRYSEALVRTRGCVTHVVHSVFATSLSLSLSTLPPALFLIFFIFFISSVPFLMSQSHFADVKARLLLFHETRVSAAFSKEKQRVSNLLSLVRPFALAIAAVSERRVVRIDGEEFEEE